MSVSDDYMSESSEPDFSASEDEWLPPLPQNEKKSKVSATLVSSDSSDTDIDNDNLTKKPLNTITSKKKLRKCTPKAETPGSPVSPSAKVLKILQKTQFKPKRMIAVKDDGDSESSGDDYLIDPNNIDFRSEFFDTSEKTDSMPINFDCNAGINLTDSSEDDEIDHNVAHTSEINKRMINHINKSSDLGLAQLEQFSKNIEAAKSHLEKFKSKTLREENLNVSDLLAMGEKGVGKKKKKVESDNSDWEEVEDSQKVEPKVKDVEIMLLTGIGEKKKKVIDLDAAIKRQINRVKKENHVYMHKVNILCYIAHGNYVNSVLNSTNLPGKILSLIPSSNCYPKDRTNIDYFEQITKYFKKVVTLKEKSFYCPLKKLPPLETSLNLQIKSKTALCKRDFILLFIILLRSMGIHCRLVMSLVVVPKKIPQNQLYPITVKVSSKNKKNESDESESESKSKKASTKTKPNSGKRKQESSKIPQLDGNDDSLSKKSKKIRLTKDDEEATQRQFLKKQSNGKIEKTLKEPAIFSPRKTRNQRNAAMEQTESSKKMKIESKPSVTSSNKPNLSKLKTSAVPKTIVESKTSSREPNLAVLNNKISNPLPEASTSSSSSARPNLSVLKTKVPVVKEKENPKMSSRSKLKASTSKSPFPNLEKLKNIDKRVLSTDEDESKADDNRKKKNGVDIWIEVFAEEEEKWITLDVLSGKVHCLEYIVKNATHPLTYVLAWNNDGTIKDVSARYCHNFTTVTRRLRVEQEWLGKALRKYKGKKTARDILEDKRLNKIQMETPLPTTISEYKNHPLYALKRHLLKFEGIYPPDAPPMGFIKDEVVYARECVHILHSREMWLKSAKTVKMHESPYKIVSARPKYDRATGTSMPALPLELFGHWQTEDYVPPTAEDGIVPRNAYGNVELFKACMLPKKTVHLQLPSLNKICKQLNIDCAPAVTGFDFHCGSSHPVYDGYVVCEEFKDLLLDAWHKEMEMQGEKEQAKYEARVYGNWKKLIKGLLIRRKLKNKYNFDNL